MKLWNYIVIFTGVSILMALAGLNVAGFSDLFNIIGITISSSGLGSVEVESSLWSFIFGTTGLLITVGASTAIGIGTFVYTKDKAFLMIPIITSVFFYWISVLISIVNYVKPYPVFGLIIGVILLALSIGFIQSCVDWFLGMD